MSQPANTNSSRTTDIYERLNTRFKTNSVWKDLFESTSRVINEHITKPREQLTTIRDPRIAHRGSWVQDDTDTRVIVNHIHLGAGGETTIHAQLPGKQDGIEFNIPSNTKEREVLISGARFHGFNYFSSTLSDEDYARIMEWVELYWPESGSPSFVRFIGFIKNMSLDINQLWSDVVAEGTVDLPEPAEPVYPQTPETFVPTTDDYYPYLDSVPEGTPNYKGGKSFLTSHVELMYDAIENPSVDVIDLFYLFYYLAPIHLVLLRIVGTIKTEIPTADAMPSPILQYYESATLETNLDVNIENKFGAMGEPILFTEMALMILDGDFIQSNF